MFPGNYTSQKTSYLPPNQEPRLTDSVNSSSLRDEASWSKWPTAGILGRRATRDKAGLLLLFHIHLSTRSTQSCVQGWGESIVRSLSEGSASTYIELQNPKTKVWYLKHCQC